MSTGVVATPLSIMSTGVLTITEIEEFRAVTTEHRPSAQRPPKERCSYCKGKTHDDIYGNCSACGAPRD